MLSFALVLSFRGACIGLQNAACPCPSPGAQALAAPTFSTSCSPYASPLPEGTLFLSLDRLVRAILSPPRLLPRPVPASAVPRMAAPPSDHLSPRGRNHPSARLLCRIATYPVSLRTLSLSLHRCASLSLFSWDALVVPTPPSCPCLLLPVFIQSAHRGLFLPFPPAVSAPPTFPSRVLTAPICMPLARLSLYLQ